MILTALIRLEMMTYTTIPGADLRSDHEDKKYHDPKNAPDDSTRNGKESSEVKVSMKKQEPITVEPGQEVENANRKFLLAIVDHWNEREKTAFIQDLTPIYG